jgi:glycosyltransferase involved in cell wall biosynthesis
MGFDPPAGPPPPPPAAVRDLGPYLVYAGRLEEGKRVPVAVDHVMRLAGERRDGPALVLMGRGGYRAPASARGHVVELGYVSEEEKRAVYSGAAALVNPSEMESLSIVLMEAWLEGTPAIVASGSEVMNDHVARSGGGMTFGSYDEFRDAAGRVLDNPGERERMGARGRTYALEEYGWPAVWERLTVVAERLAP